MPLAQENRYTMADLLADPEEQRIELINGYPTMLASPSRTYQDVVMELSYQLRGYLQGKQCKVYTAPFAVRLFERNGDDPEDVDTLVEPDICVVCDLSKLDKIGCKGAPDLIMEVLSPSTARNDRLIKYNLYRQAGVRQFWIVDPLEKTAEVFLLEDEHYVPVDFGESGDRLRVHIFQDCTIDLAQVFAE